jgi:hypothetical protein
MHIGHEICARRVQRTQKERHKNTSTTDPAAQLRAVRKVEVFSETVTAPSARLCDALLAPHARRAVEIEKQL